MPTCDEWNTSADWYDANMGECGDALNRERLRPLVLEMLGDVAGRVVVDFGCGSGYLAAELARSASHVIGADFAPAFIELCRRKYAGREHLEFVAADALGSWPLPDRSVDVVLCKMVLQYVPEIATFVGEARRVLRGGGRLLVVVDHPFHAAYAHARQVAGAPPDPKLGVVGDYFDRTARVKRSLWGRVDLTWYPRTFSDYAEALAGGGFTIDGVREVADEKDGLRVPRVLALRGVSG